MSTPKKRTPVKGKGKAMGATVAAMAIDKAREALQDEKTRQMLLDHGKAIAVQAQQWRKDRQAPETSGEERSRLGERFGQGKLERRVDNLQQSVTFLGGGRPELAEALAPIGAALGQIGGSLDVASRLPIVKRKQAHHAIDQELDRLEKFIFEASLPSAEGGGS